MRSKVGAQRPCLKAAFSGWEVIGFCCGLISVADSIRPEASDLVRQLKAAGVRHVAMLTGDNQGTADAVGRAVGVDEVRAELLPEDKMQAIQEIQRKHGGTAMVGDVALHVRASGSIYMPRRRRGFWTDRLPFSTGPAASRSTTARSARTCSMSGPRSDEVRSTTPSKTAESTTTSSVGKRMSHVLFGTASATRWPVCSMSPVSRLAASGSCGGTWSA